MREAMGSGVCSRRQRRLFQALLLLSLALGFIYGAVLYDDFRNQLKKAEAVATKHQQHQENLSAQLQVVYEHRSRLEKSLQKERLEHKKAKEDFLVYKLEAQETLNKGRQDANNRYSALNVQHQMLKNQHEELKKQHVDLQQEHQKRGEDLTRALGDHKEKYFQLQQEKEQELSKMKENIYNLREENRQLRKAHQDVHAQLQDVRQQHKTLQLQHERAVLTLEDHKSALAVAQNQLEEYKQLKDTLNKMPSLLQPDKTATEQPIFPQTTPSVPEGFPAQENAAQGGPNQSNENPLNEELKIKHANVQRTDEVETFPEDKKIEVHHPTVQNTPQPEVGEPTGHQIDDMGDEHKKELEEEEMAQVGKPERLEEDQDQEENRWKEEEQHDNQEGNHQYEGQRVDERAEETNRMAERTDSERGPLIKPVVKYKSAFEEQLEQQRLAAQRAEESRQLKEHQESLYKQRVKGHILRQQQLHEKELSMQRHNEFQEQLHKQRLRQQAHYEHTDHDLVQGEEEHVIQGGAYEKDNQHQDEGEELDDTNNANEPLEPDENDQNGKAAVEDVNPADDPNNQGEDEFEEAGQDGEDNQSDNNEQKPPQQKPQTPEVEEHLVMAGNPDQQEDNLDEQYQEEGEEVQEDLTEEKKRDVEHHAEAPYGENDENVDDKNVGVDPEQETLHDNQKEHEENYEEEEEEDGAAVGKTNRRAEM